jgi:hypothetical protein
MGGFFDILQALFQASKKIMDLFFCPFLLQVFDDFI